MLKLEIINGGITIGESEDKNDYIVNLISDTGNIFQRIIVKKYHTKSARILKNKNDSIYLGDTLEILTDYSGENLDFKQTIEEDTVNLKSLKLDYRYN